MSRVSSVAAICVLLVSASCRRAVESPSAPALDPTNAAPTATVVDPDEWTQYGEFRDTGYARFPQPPEVSLDVARLPWGRARVVTWRAVDAGTEYVARMYELVGSRQLPDRETVLRDAVRRLAPTDVAPHREHATTSTPFGWQAVYPGPDGTAWVRAQLRDDRVLVLSVRGAVDEEVAAAFLSSMTFGLGTFAPESWRNRDFVRDAVRERFDEVVRCVDYARVSSPEVEGRVGVRFFVRQGKPSEISVTQDTVDDPDLVTCLTEVTATLEFPATGAASELVAPWVYVVGPDDAYDRWRLAVR